MKTDLPGLVLATTVWLYWGYVGALSLRKRRRSGSLAGIVPSQPLEQLMWLAWLPLVAAWMTLPVLAVVRPHGFWALPAFAADLPYAPLRWLAAAAGALCLRYSIRSWRRMGRHWSMAITRGERTELVTSGPFARVRHPIYALSIGLMLCTLLVVPTLPVLVIALVHIALMLLKARNEERHLLGVHGEAYADYCRQTARFIPWRGRRA